MREIEESERRLNRHQSRLRCSLERGRAGWPLIYKLFGRNVRPQIQSEGRPRRHEWNPVVSSAAFFLAGRKVPNKGNLARCLSDLFFRPGNDRDFRRLNT